MTASPSSFGVLLRTPLSDATLLDLIRKERWYRKAANARRTQHLALLRERIEESIPDWMQISREALTLRRAFSSPVKAGAHDESTEQPVRSLLTEACALRDRLDRTWNSFQDRSYEPLRGNEVERGVCRPAVRKEQDRVDQEIAGLKEMVAASDRVIASTIEKCRKRLKEMNDARRGGVSIPKRNQPKRRTHAGSHAREG